MTTSPRLPAALADEWTALLAEHDALLDALIGAAESRKASLVAVDRSALEAATLREEALLARVRALEDRRRGLMDRSAAVLRLPAAGLTVGRIVAQAGDAGAALRESRAGLLRKGKSLQRLQRINRMLIEQSLGHVQDFLRLLAGQGAEDATYSRAGLQRQSPAGTLMVNHVV
jgi:flagellar biosynthesis/type III secretory pathway chaperone